MGGSVSMVDGHIDCECTIGLLHLYTHYELVDLCALKKHIEDMMEVKRKYELCIPGRTKRVWQLRDYADRRKNTDLTRFSYCPDCGKKIDWKSIKKSDVGDSSGC